MEFNSVATNIQNAMMMQGISKNMPMNIPNKAQSLKGVSENMPFNHEHKNTDREYIRETYYNYNAKGERVMIRQIGHMVDITVL